MTTYTILIVIAGCTSIIVNVESASVAGAFEEARSYGYKYAEYSLVR